MRVYLKSYSSEKCLTGSEESSSQYFYHSDHLGSAQLVTNQVGEVYQRIEYTPYGETWIDMRTNITALYDVPYRFTAKELDKETGLYYYGARYLDPKYSRWISVDPALGEYIPGAGKSDEADKLPGMGGVFNSVNLSLFHYAGNNPVRYVDPSGEWIVNNTSGYIAVRLEDEIDSPTEPGKKIDTVILAPGDKLPGGYDGARDANGTFYKVTCKSGEGPIDFSIEEDGSIKFLNKYSKKLNDSGDFKKKVYNFFIFWNKKVLSGAFADVTGNKKTQTAHDSLQNAWEETMLRDVGNPDEWEKKYNSDEQKALREELKKIKQEEHND